MADIRKPMRGRQKIAKLLHPLAAQTEDRRLALEACKMLMILGGFVSTEAIGTLHPQIAKLLGTEQS